ncbi:hypothetical protein CDD82_7254 [Ophiocordyceps australis]|uniref:Uncharacterized protein n=1 Tax=Ophiocordyceps australis TaxID=1399860 RepID=A0A2C5YRS8_9HYPO|nr:hypothetical protein CDD82_7254 [Ophiocordyceps australis]
MPSPGSRHSLRGPSIRYVQRFVPAAAQKIFRGNQFLTNPEGRDFLLRHGLEPDNGKMPLFAPNKVIRELIKAAQISLAFSPSYFIHPFDLVYFGAKGHPLAAMTMSRYTRKIRDHSLWIMTTSVMVQSPVVRDVARSRLTTALHGHLRGRGYTMGTGRGPGREIQGTLWLINHNPAASLKISADVLTCEIAQALDLEYGSEII